MAEWPKKAIAIVAAAKYGSNWDPFAQDYIPADLGRELYEALRDADVDRDPTGGLDYHPHPALARYEREVGNG